MTYYEASTCIDVSETMKVSTAAAASRRFELLLSLDGVASTFSGTLITSGTGITFEYDCPSEASAMVGYSVLTDEDGVVLRLADDENGISDFARTGD
jgi:hypothetical protein